MYLKSNTPRMFGNAPTPGRSHQMETEWKDSSRMFGNQQMDSMQSERGDNSRMFGKPWITAGSNQMEPKWENNPRMFGNSRTAVESNQMEYRWEDDPRMLRNPRVSAGSNQIEPRWQDNPNMYRNPGIATRGNQMEPRLVDNSRMFGNSSITAGNNQMKPSWEGNSRNFRNSTTTTGSNQSEPMWEGDSRTFGNPTITAGNNQTEPRWEGDSRTFGNSRMSNRSFQAEPRWKDDSKMFGNRPLTAGSSQMERNWKDDSRMFGNRPLAAGSNQMERKWKDDSRTFENRPVAAGRNQMEGTGKNDSSNFGNPRLVTGSNQMEAPSNLRIFGMTAEASQVQSQCQDTVMLKNLPTIAKSNLVGLKWKDIPGMFGNPPTKAISNTIAPSPTLLAASLQGHSDHLNHQKYPAPGTAHARTRKRAALRKKKKEGSGKVQKKADGAIPSNIDFSSDSFEGGVRLEQGTLENESKKLNSIIKRVSRGYTEATQIVEKISLKKPEDRNLEDIHILSVNQERIRRYKVFDHDKMIIHKIFNEKRKQRAAEPENLTNLQRKRIQNNTRLLEEYSKEREVNFADLFSDELTVAIIDRSDVDGTMKVTSWKMVEPKILDVIAKNPDNINEEVDFVGHISYTGVPVICCLNTKSVEALKTVINDIGEPWDNAQLEVVPASWLLLHRVTISFPTPNQETPEETVALIGSQNNINTSLWKIFSFRMAEQSLIDLVCWIDDESLRRLELSEGKIKFNSDELKLEISSRRKIPEKHSAATDVADASGCAN